MIQPDPTRNIIAINNFYYTQGAKKQRQPPFRNKINLCDPKISNTIRTENHGENALHCLPIIQKLQ